jgi:hypothetical protein
MFCENTSIQQQFENSKILDSQNFDKAPYLFDILICENPSFLHKYKSFIKEKVISKFKIPDDWDEFVLNNFENGFYNYSRVKSKKVFIYWCWYKTFLHEYFGYLNIVKNSIYENNHNLADVHIIMYPSLILDNKKTNIQITGEHSFSNWNLFNYNLTSYTDISKRQFCYPYFCQVLDTRNNYENIFKKRNENSISSMFCSFIHSNSSCEIRNLFFKYLCENYKKVNSYGRLFNNMDKVYEYTWFDDEQIELIGKHKFALCFENSRNDDDYYITEKILNAKLSGAVPIYWGTSKCKDIFENDSFLFLEGNTIDDFKNLLNKIKILDNNDEKYLEMKNKPLIIPNKINHLRSNYLKTILNL